MRHWRALITEKDWEIVAVENDINDKDTNFVYLCLCQMSADFGEFNPGARWEDRRAGRNV